jgi:hypothetical protein
MATLDDHHLRLGPGLVASADGADGTPSDSFGQIQVSQPGHFVHSSRKRTSRRRIRRITSSGIRRVHDRTITSPRQVHDRSPRSWALTRDTGNPRGMTPPLPTATRSVYSVAHHDAVPVFHHPSGGDVRSAATFVAALDGITQSRSGSLPGHRYKQNQRAASREGQDSEEPTDRDARHPPVRRAVLVPAQRDKAGRGSAKQAVPRTAPPARTLSAICP